MVGMRVVNVKIFSLTQNWMINKSQLKSNNYFSLEQNQLWLNESQKAKIKYNSDWYKSIDSHCSRRMTTLMFQHTQSLYQFKREPYMKTRRKVAFELPYHHQQFEGDEATSTNWELFISSFLIPKNCLPFFLLVLWISHQNLFKNTLSKQFITSSMLRITTIEKE